MMKATLRQISIDHLRNGQQVTHEYFDDFMKYLEVYCIELKHTEWDVLLDDEHYEKFYHLFDSVMVNRLIV